MGMFQNYKLIPENYIPNNTCYTSKQPPIPKYPLVAYNKLDEPVGFTWNYGDTICLEFNTTGNVIYDPEEGGAGFGFVEDANTYLTAPIINREEGAENYLKVGQKIFEILIYDFRYEIVAKCEVPAALNVKIYTSDFQPCMINRGAYKLQLNLIDKVANTKYTLINGDDCNIFIK